MFWWTVQVGLAITRPPTVQEISNWKIQACCAASAELTAISAATQVWKAEMPVSSTIIEWEEEARVDFCESH